ncbi:4-alpha-glucanotransferase DPE2 [Platanthera zijinensis]|uniref:4-alpha-glucanotransferase n=1 Tax=Platanthera zijinensis TaxID=2320716 RepID=A0AAP0AYL7_9ASPA
MTILVSKKSSLSSVTLIFRIPYYTQWGQSLLISGSIPVLGAGNVKQGLGLIPFHQGEELIWQGKISVPIGFQCEYCYYLVDDHRNILRWEAGMKRKVSLPAGINGGEVVEIHDLWQAASEALFLKSAFKNVIFSSGQNLQPELPFGSKQRKDDQEDSIVVQFKISCPTVEDGTSVYVTGSAPQLGQWRVEDGLRLSYIGDYSWEAYSAIRKDHFPIKYPSRINLILISFYKYCQSCKKGDISLEIGPYRELALDMSSSSLPKYVTLSDGSFRATPWRGAGVAIPMFSVRTNEDLGVGEFLDLKLLVDLAVESGFHLIQLLPINDTSVHGMWWDSYPYSSLSVFALHPLYLRVQLLSENIPDNLKQEILMEKKRLDKKDVDYEATMAAKLAIAKKIFIMEKDQILNSSLFIKFVSDNEEWLKPYAAFCFLRDFFGTSDHSQWGRFAEFSKEKLEKLLSKDTLHYDVICFHYYIQFHLHLQATNFSLERCVICSKHSSYSTNFLSYFYLFLLVYYCLFSESTSGGGGPFFFNLVGQQWSSPTTSCKEFGMTNFGEYKARLTSVSPRGTAARPDSILASTRIDELRLHNITNIPGTYHPSVGCSTVRQKRCGIRPYDLFRTPKTNQKHLEQRSPCFLNQKQPSSKTTLAVTVANFTSLLNNPSREHCQHPHKPITKLATKAQQPSSSLCVQILIILYFAMKNIVLIRDCEEHGKFYPRFNLEDTSSFQKLDDHSKHVLKRLYYDYYFHRQEILWRENAMKTLPALLSSSDMLACGEDLGLIPSCVHPVMQELGLIGLRIQRMPSEPGLQFGIPSQYNYMTVCAPSCHDCSTMRAWWEEDEERRCRFFKDVIGSNDEPPSQCTPEVANFILQQHFLAPSMWAIFPLQDVLALKEEYTDRPANEETINDPTNPKHYWRFRMHVTLESLLGDEDLKITIKDLVASSARSYPISEYEMKKKQVENIEDELFSRLQLSGD